MTWSGLLFKGVLSGAIVVGASELAKSKSILGALLISLPVSSILAIIWLWRDTGDVSKVADLSNSILWLVIPSLVLLAVLPWLLRRGWDFTPALLVATVCTIAAYGAGVWAASTFAPSS